MGASIVERAKQVQRKAPAAQSNASPDLIEIAVAWLAGEITWSQAATVLNVPIKKSPYGYFGPALREAYRRGKLVKGA